MSKLTLRQIFFGTGFLTIGVAGVVVGWMAGYWQGFVYQRDAELYAGRAGGLVAAAEFREGRRYLYRIEGRVLEVEGDADGRVEVRVYENPGKVGGIFVDAFNAKMTELLSRQ